MRHKKAEIAQKPNDQTMLYEDVLYKDVYDQNGHLLGKVTEIIQSPAHDVLVIVKENEEILIPYLENFVKEIAETITVDISALQ